MKQGTPSKFRVRFFELKGGEIVPYGDSWPLSAWAASKSERWLFVTVHAQLHHEKYGERPIAFRLTKMGEVIWEGEIDWMMGRPDLTTRSILDRAYVQPANS